jgi:hypothetical protein
MHRSQCFCYFFFNAFWESCWAPTAILPRSSQLCENVKICSFTFNMGSSKRMVVWGMTVVLFLVNNSSVKMEVWEVELSWCNSQFLCRQSSGRSVHASLCSCCKTSQRYAELTVWPNRKNSFRTMSKKSSCRLLPLPASLFWFPVSLDFPCMARVFFPALLSNHCQCLWRIFPEICTTFDAVPLSDPSRNRIHVSK